MYEGGAGGGDGTHQTKNPSHAREEALEQRAETWGSEETAKRASRQKEKIIT